MQRHNATASTSTSASAVPERHFTSLERIEAGYWWFVARLEWATRLITPWAARKLEPFDYADIGCGTGGFAREIAAQFNTARVALVDGNTGALKRLPRHEKFEIVEADISRELTLPFRPDLITLMDVIEHVEDDAALLTKAASLLNPGGLLVLSVPAHQWLYSEWDRGLGHHRRYGAGALRKLVESAGLELIELRPMWSFLVPAAPYRKFVPRTQSKLEFPEVPSFINSALIHLSRVEWALPRMLRPPFGTSLILSAAKP